jgi:DNA-binding GntR family transcriptional regulator
MPAAVEISAAMQGSAERVERLGSRVRVLDALRDEVISGHLEPGTPLSELALAERYGVSRTPIREALKQLQIEGLVEIVPRVGTFVRRPSRREVVELFELKEVLEGMGARLLARRGRVRELDLLEENLDESVAAAESGDATRYAHLVHEFHQLIMIGADSSRLLAHYQILMNQLAYHRLVVASLGRSGRLSASVSEHAAVLEHIRDKDGFGAEFAMRDHVRASERQTLAATGDAPAAGATDDNSDQED